MNSTKLYNIVSTINEKIGQVASWFIAVLIIVTVYEVAARYIFNRPTSWAWDTNCMILLFLGLACGGYSVVNNVHIRIDLVYTKFPPKIKALMNMITSSLFFLTFVILFIYGGREFIQSYTMHEVRMESVWAPILWPVKLFLPIGALLFLLQGIIEFLSEYSSFRTGKERVRKELI